MNESDVNSHGVHGSPRKQNKVTKYVNNLSKRSIALVSLLVLGVLGVAYVLVYQPSVHNDAAEHQLTYEDVCSVGDENTQLPDECSVGEVGGADSACSFELPSERQANCPEEASVLGDVATPMVWPIKKENWPKVSQPIANCDLLYSKEANKTVSTGIEIAVPVGTAVYAAADGVVHYAKAGAGAIIVKTNLTSSVNTGSKPIYTSYLLLSERFVNIGDKVTKNQLIGRSGSGGTAAELSQSLHFGVWTTGDFIGGHPLLSSAAGKTTLSKMLHPMNFLPADGRTIFACPNKGPYGLPQSSATTPPPTGGGQTWTTVARPKLDFARSTYKGKRFDKYTIVLLQRSDKYIREMGLTPPAYTQGSFNSSVSASAGTHSGGGAVDVSIRNYSNANQLKILKAFRMAGFAAWIRNSNDGMPVHLHGIAIGCTTASSGAKSQVRSYFNHRNGLASNGPDRYARSVGYPMPDWAKRLK